MKSSARAALALLAVLAAPLAAEDWDDDDIEFPEAVTVSPTVSGLIPELNLSAWLEADLRHRTAPPQSYTYNTNDLGLRVRTVWDVADAQAELRLRGTGFSTVGTLDDLSRGAALDPWELELRSAFFNLYGLPLAPIDLSLGKQEVGWGVGDKVRVYNEINPGDYRDPLEFGEKLGQNMLRLTAWFGPTWFLEGLVVPTFTPSRLPVDTSLMMPEIKLPTFFGFPLWLSELNVAIETPEPSLAESTAYGLRLKGGLGAVDIELAYHYGRDSLAVPTDITLTPTIDFDAPIGTIPVIVDAVGTFPRRHLIGASFAADIADIGVWGEVGCYIYPEDVNQTIHTILGSFTETLYPAEAYFKWLGGVDYSFSGWYAQLQYVRGLHSERGRDELSDVFVLAVEKGFFYNKLTLRLAGALEVPDFDTFSDNWGTLVIPELEYRPIDQLSLTLGGRWLEGDGRAVFSRLKDEDVVYLKIRVDL